MFRTSARGEVITAKKLSKLADNFRKILPKEGSLGL